MATQSSLLSFGEVPKKKKSQSPSIQVIEELQQTTTDKEPVIYPDFPENLPPSYLVSISYDGKMALAKLSLYEPVSKKIYFWYDNTGHKPYLLTSLAPEEVEKLRGVTSHSGYDHVEAVEKYDPLHDKMVTVTKVVAKDPLAIGGRQSGCLRDIIPDDYQALTGIDEPPKVWESYIRYYQSYIYDNNLVIGMLYAIKDGNLVRVFQKSSEETIKQILAKFSDVDPQFKDTVEMWARLLESPAPEFKRVGLDIEVASAVATRVPDPQKATDPVVCVALYGSDRKKRSEPYNATHTTGSVAF